MRYYLARCCCPWYTEVVCCRSVLFGGIVVQWIVLLILSVSCYYINSPSSLHRLLVSWRWPVIFVLHPQEVLCQTTADLRRGLVTPEWIISAEEVDANDTALKAGRTWDTGGRYRVKLWTKLWGVEKGLSDGFGDVIWKISSDFIRRLMTDDLSSLSQGVTALSHLCHRYLFPTGFIKKKEREKAAAQWFQKEGES